MTTFNPNGRADPDAAERLSATWDALLTGRPTETDDEGLVAVAHQLHATTSEARERPGFRQNLRDTLMQSPTIAMPTPRGLSDHRIDPAPARLVAAGTVTMLRRTGGRWLSLAATIALLLATAASGYLAGVGLPGNDGRATSVAGFQGASPEAVSEPITVGCGPAGEIDLYTPCVERPNIVASMGIGGNFPAENLAVTRTQMQRWQLGGGESLSFSPLFESVNGIGIDVVVNGAYTARFSAPVNVIDSRSGIDNRYRAIPANTTIELVTGDAVSYELGTKLEVANPFGSSMLWFKTILFYDGDPSPEGLNATGPIQMTVDGDGALPKPLLEYGPSGVQIVLSYSQIVPGYPFPPEWSADQVILGPVDPVAGPVGTEGFILWAFQGQG